MNRWQQFERLAAAAAREPTPEINVARQVLRRLHRSARAEMVNRPLLICSGLSALAASIAAVVTIYSLQTLMDPLSGLFNVLTMVMQ